MFINDKVLDIIKIRIIFSVTLTLIEFCLVTLSLFRPHPKQCFIYTYY